MKPTKCSVWRYIGPDVDMCPKGQLHLVVLSHANEVITIGLPYGNCGSWLGTPELFAQHFEFFRDKL